MNPAFPTAGPANVHYDHYSHEKSGSYLPGMKFLQYMGQAAHQDAHKLQKQLYLVSLNVYATLKQVTRLSLSVRHLWS